MTKNLRQTSAERAAGRNRAAVAGSPPKNVHRPTRPTDDLSPVDRRIVEILRRQARTPNNAIAAEVGVAASTCLTRIRSLEERGVITGYHAEVDLEALGVPIQAMIAVRLRAGARDKLGEFTDRITSRPEVLSVFFLAGHEDFLIQVAVADPGGLRDFVLEELSANPQVASTQTNLIFEQVRGAGLLPGGTGVRA